MLTDAVVIAVATPENFLIHIDEAKVISVSAQIKIQLIKFLGFHAVVLSYY